MSVLQFPITNFWLSNGEGKFSKFDYVLIKQLKNM